MSSARIFNHCLPTMRLNRKASYFKFLQDVLCFGGVSRIQATILKAKYGTRLNKMIPVLKSAIPA